jgi:hypothetical protein
LDRNRPAQIRNRGAPGPRSLRQWPVDSGGDQRQGGPGRGARATWHGGETTEGTSERRAHWRGSFHKGAARSEGNGGEGRCLGGQQLVARKGGQGTDDHWGGVDGVGGQPEKLDGGRCPAAGE